VGFLKGLARYCPDLETPILTGVSAGAVNAAFLANHTGSFAQKAEALEAVWHNAAGNCVFRVSRTSAARLLGAWLRESFSSATRTPFHAHSLVDAAPLCEMLHRILTPVNHELPGIASNIASGRLKAVAVTASSYSTGQSVTWVQGSHKLWNQSDGRRKTVRCRLRLDHILASASLPLFFPAIRIHRRWFGDGGIRMTAPLSPAVQLGANRILAIHTRSLPTHQDLESRDLHLSPSPSQIAGTLFDAIFLDVFDDDAARLQRVNDLIRHVPVVNRKGMRPVELQLIRPSIDLGKLAVDYVDSLPAGLRLLAGGSGRDHRSIDTLSLVLFHPDYLRKVMQLGEQDAAKHEHMLRDFLTHDADPLDATLSLTAAA
jgi:NTE family protein